MIGRNALAVLVAGLLLATSSAAAESPASRAGARADAASGERQASRIMPCGDSITYDNHSGDVRPAGLRIGYRQPLWHMLKDAGFNVDFVGSVVAGQDALPAFDPDSEGHPGWRDDQIADNIYDWLTATPADVVLLHIGTNALDTSAADVEDILDEIDRYETDHGATVTVLLARIINRMNHVCPNASTTTTFNNNVQSMAQARIGAGDDIVLVDLECGAGMDYSEAPAGDMYDNLHPTDNGYWKMAAGWFGHLKDILVPENALAGMTHYWKLEDAGGPPYVNAMGAGDAGCSACPAYTYEGRVWGCLEFDGENDEVEVPDDGSFDWGVEESFTIEFWMKKGTACDGGTVNDNEVIVGRDDPATDLHWWVGVVCGHTPGGVASFQLRDTGFGGEAIFGTTVLTDGDWHHVVAVRDAAADSNLLYVDGSREAAVAYDYLDGFGGVTPLDIGFMTLSQHFRYEGLVDEIALYDRALSPDEIASHHTGGLEGMGYAQSSTGAPSITSEPLTEVRVGQVYAYDAQATGAPAPSFSLGAHPAAMQIDGVSGLVTWLPGASDLGSHAVDVVATNEHGTDTQSFVLDVLEQSVCPDDMSHYWPLDDGSGTTPDDHYAALDGSLHGAPVWTTGVVGGAIDFNGTTQYMTVPDDASIDWAADASFTVEVWAKFTNYSARNKVMVGRDNRPDGCHWWLGANQGTGVANLNLLDDDNQGIACTGSTFIADGGWHHIVAVRNNADDTNRLYVDGALEDTKSFNYGAGWGAGTTLGVGYMAYTGVPDYFYDGMLDEIALYDRALPLTEIQEHYTDGLAGLGYCSLTETAPVITTSPVTGATVGIPYSYDADAAGYPAPAFSLGDHPASMQVNTATGLITWTPEAGDDGVHSVELLATNSVGADTQAYILTVLEAPECPAEMTAYWRLDESSGPTYDDSFGSHDGASANAPTAITGLVGGAQRFDGGGDNISVPAHADFDWGRDSSFTIEYWMRKDTPCGGNTIPDNEVIVGRDDDDPGATDIHWWTGVWCSGSPQGVAVFQLRDENREGDHVAGTTFLLDGDWHHVVCVRDGVADANRLYVDGGLEGTLHYDYGAGFSSANAEPIEIGMEHNAFYYDGDTDEIAIYGRALTLPEIEAHYTAGLAGQGYCQVESGVAPVIVSTPVTGAAVGVPYAYDADATGDPAPAFALGAHPPGMTIVEATGVVEWTPAFGQEGPNPVEVIATNTAGFDTQSYTIDVSQQVENVVCVPDTLILATGSQGGSVDVRYLGGGSGLVYSYSVSLAWNDSIAATSVPQVTEGNLLSDAGLTFFSVRETRAGRELTVDCALLGDVDGVTGPGTMFTIEFEPVGPGSTVVDVTVIKVRDKDNVALTGFWENDALVVVDDEGPDVRDVFIENLTLAHTDDYIKDTDAARISATVVDDGVITIDDVTADLTGLGGAAAVHPDALTDTLATWNLASVACGGPDGLRTVTVYVTDSSGHSDADSDGIIADNTPPGAVTDFDAAPGHGLCELSWVNGADDNLLGVAVRRSTVPDDYPSYAAFCAAWPTNEAEALYPATAADGVGVYDGVPVTSHVDGIPDRGILFYQAFCYDIVMQYGPAATTAGDLAINYLLGDVTDGAGGYDGEVQFEDLMVFSINYGAVGPTGVVAECDFGPAVHADSDGIGVPLPDGVIEFEDLMVFARNYGAAYKRLPEGTGAVLDIGPAGDGELLLSLVRLDSTDAGVVQLALRLSGNEDRVKGLSTELEFDSEKLEFVSARLSGRMDSPVFDVFLWNERTEGGVAIDLAVLGAQAVIGGSGDLAVIEFRAIDPDVAVGIVSADLRGAGNEKLQTSTEGYDSATDVPLEFRLVQNMPNPFNPVTTIAYHVPRSCDLTVRVYDIGGRLVATLVDGHTRPGRHAVAWNGTDDGGGEVASGVYFCTMQADGFSDSRKMLLLK